MFTRTLIAFLAAASVCAGQQIPQLALYLHFDSLPSTSFVRAMEHEVGVVLPGFGLEWIRTGKAPLGVINRTFMVRFTGLCAAPPRESPSALSTRLARGDRITLGDSVAADGHILPYSTIDCDGVLALLRTVDLSAAGEEMRLGRATGRVLAHELYHVLLQTAAHSRTGIAKAIHTPASLLSPSLLFEEGELRRMALLYKP